jgi:adenylyl-sulfate kinase
MGIIDRPITMNKRYLHREPGKVSFEDRCESYHQKAAVFWFTGLSGAGKSTIADQFEKTLFGLGQIVYTLDADDLRKHLNADLGFSMKDREENVRRAAESARLLQESGVIVLATFISPTIVSREKARSIARDGLFFEIYVKASLETCIDRDPKGFYQKANNGEIQNYTGIDSTYEEPPNADLVLNTETNNIDTCVQQLLEFALVKGVISKEA